MRSPAERTARLPARTRLVLVLAVLAGQASRRAGYGAGGTIPGRVLLLLAPRSLSQLSRSRRVVLVSGTNGKTTTTRMLSGALRTRGPVISNSDGSNMLAGLASALLSGRHDAVADAALEVDELALPAALRQTRPAAVLLLNLSRDQLDRVGEVSGHVSRWSAALSADPSVLVVANADDPLVVAAVLAARPTGERVTWVGAGQVWRADAVLCPRCAHPLDRPAAGWGCAGCGLSRPAAAWSLQDDLLRVPDGDRLPLDLQLPGRANRANAAMALAAAEVLGVPTERALASLREITEVQGRYLVADVEGHAVRLLLAKNPAGWFEALQELRQGSTPVLIAINAQTADGTDPSWLWDVPFELLTGRRVVAAGERARDLAVRLVYADVAHDISDDPLAALERLPHGPCDLIANYTAFVRARRGLLIAGNKRSDSPVPSW